MSDGERLLLFLSLIYLVDCLLWVDRRTILFASGFGGRWRGVVADYLWGNSSGRLFLLNPLPPLGFLFVARLLPVSLSPTSLVAFNLQTVGNSGRPPQSGRMARIEPGTEFSREGSELLVDGRPFCDVRDAETARACDAAALLHDTGRYEQLKRYNTFRDSDSVDHAVFSHDIVVEKGWLDDDPQREAILTAVLVHNRRDVPDNLDPLTEAAVHTVRDADKLDIFRVLEHQVATTDWRTNCEAFWNLPTRAAPSPAVVAAIRDSRPVDYQNIKTLADFVLIQVGWMRCGLRYATSRRLCAERGHLAFRRDFLHQLTDDPAVDELCELARIVT